MQSVKIGDTREDGLVLYERRKKGEWWVTPEQFEKKQKIRLAQRKRYNEKNKARLKAYYREHYKRNKEKHNIKCKKYYKENFDTISKKKKLYFSKNREKFSAWDRAKRKIDIVYKFKGNARTRIGQAIRLFGFKKGSKTEQIIGCSWETFKLHIENQFLPGMSWENWGRGASCWHIDHIIPLCSAKTQEDLSKLCRYSNTQPLWEEDNLRKGKLTGPKLCGSLSAKPHSGRK